MSNAKFNLNASTLEEYTENVRFQLENVEGWLSTGYRENAAIKAGCLRQATEQLMAAFEAKARAARISAEKSAAVRQAAKTPAVALPTAAGQRVSRKKVAPGRWQVGRMLVEFDHSKTAEEVA